MTSQYPVAQSRPPYLGPAADNRMKELPPTLHAGFPQYDTQENTREGTYYTPHNGYTGVSTQPSNSSGVFYDASGNGDTGYLVDEEDKVPQMQQSMYVPPRSTLPPTRKGLWTYDDLHAFKRRSFFARLFRVLGFIFVYGIWLAIVAILLVALFIRPPNLGVRDPEIPSFDDVSYQNGEFNFLINITAVISNPNTVPIDVKKFNARLYDKTNQRTSIGNCSLPNDFEIKANSNTTVKLPCTVSYDTEKDPNLSVISDLACRCGLIKNSKKQKIEFDVKTDLTVVFIAFYVPTSFTPSISFDCPLNMRMIKDILGKNAEGIMNKFSCSGINNRRARSVDGLPMPENLVQHYVRNLAMSAMDGLRHTDL